MSGFPLNSFDISERNERKSLIIADRSVETVSAWFEKHPSVEIVSRDRSSEYAAAIKKGAPQAIEVADRWHLGKNLAESITTVALVWRQRKVGPWSSSANESAAMWD